MDSTNNNPLTPPTPQPGTPLTPPAPQTPQPQPQPLAPQTPQASEHPSESLKEPELPNAQPDSKPTPSKKSHKTVAIMIILLVLVAGGVFAALYFTGAISFNPETGISFGGSNPTPSLELADELCKKYPENSSQSIVGDDLNRTVSSSSPLSGHLTFAYACTSSAQAPVQFILYGLDSDVISNPDYTKELFGDIKNRTTTNRILEDSDSYLKIIRNAPYGNSANATMSAAYKNFVVQVLADSIETAEDALVALGFPNRSRTTTEENNGIIAAIDAHSQDAVDKVFAALEQQKSLRGRYPAVVSTSGSWQNDIDGSGGTELDSLLNSLGLKDYYGKPFRFDALDPSLAGNGGHTEDDDVYIHYGYYCNSSTDDSGNITGYYAQRSYNESDLAITLHKAKGGTVCAGTKH